MAASNSVSSASNSNVNTNSSSTVSGGGSGAGGGGSGGSGGSGVGSSSSSSNPASVVAAAAAAAAVSSSSNKTSASGMVPNIQMVSQYIQTGLPFYQQPVYSYEDIQMMQQRVPHVVSSHMEKMQNLEKSINPMKISQTSIKFHLR